MPGLARLVLTLCISLITCGMAAAQQVTVEKESNLVAEPRPDAAVVAKLPKGATGEAIGKQGVWVNVKTPQATGWLLSFNVRFGGADATSASGSAGASRLFGGQKPQVTATIGVRGLDAEDLKNASFDAQQLELLDKYAASKEEGEQAAQTRGLVALKLDYMLK